MPFCRQKLTMEIPLGIREVALLGQLVDGQRRLAYKDQIAGQAAGRTSPT